MDFGFSYGGALLLTLVIHMLGFLMWTIQITDIGLFVLYSIKHLAYLSRLFPGTTFFLGNGRIAALQLIL
jgi:hypothetical protein